MGGFGSGSQLEEEELVAKLAPCGDATHEVKLGLVHGLGSQHAGVVAQWMLCALWVWTIRVCCGVRLVCGCMQAWLVGCTVEVLYEGSRLRDECPVLRVATHLCSV